MAGYTLLYGSVAAVVVTLLWLYMSGLVLIMGAEFNAVLHRNECGYGERKKRQ
jgi:membrane protein